MNRFLIWSIAFGPRGKALAPLWLSGLRDFGQWEGDIVLLGDDSMDGLISPRLRAIRIEEDIYARYNLPRHVWDKWTINNFKTQLVNHVDLITYDYLLYLDLDVLVNTTAIGRLVRNTSERGAVAFQRDYAGVYRYHTLPETVPGPDEAERVLWDNAPICAGMMGFPTHSRGIEILMAYHRACERSNFRGSDQAKLMMIMNRDFPGEWEFLQDATFGRRAKPPYSEALLHFVKDPDLRVIRAYHRNRSAVLPGSLAAGAQQIILWGSRTLYPLRRLAAKVRARLKAGAFLREPGD